MKGRSGKGETGGLGDWETGRPVDAGVLWEED
jgi:hypothetical protein